MARNPKKAIRSDPRKQVLNLSDVRDTSETSQGSQKEEPLQDKQREFVEVPPPFQGQGQGQGRSGYITRSEVTFGWKIAVIIASIFIVVGVPVVWFASSLNSNVQNIRSDLDVVQEKTETLLERSIRQDEKLEAFEKSISRVQEKLDAQPNQTEKVDKKATTKSSKL